MTPEEARAYFKRWDLVRDAEAAELRRTTMETKLQQLAALMASRHLFGPEPDRQAQVDKGRQRVVFERTGGAMNTNNPRYWFRAKRYGLGWGLPLAWQGWLFFFSWILIVALGLRFLTPESKPTRWAFLVAMVILSVVVCYWKGEPTGRRWNRGDGT